MEREGKILRKEGEKRRRRAKKLEGYAKERRNKEWNCAGGIVVMR
jgi:hypothetical protein